MVNLMENKNQGLDSIERRRTLANILKIPPVLLGLGSLDLIVAIATGQEAPPSMVEEKRTLVGKESLKRYQSTFKVYQTLFAQGLTYASFADIERWTQTLASETREVQTAQKSAFLRTLWDFEILCAKAASSDLGDYARSIEHLNNALEIATLLDNRDLQAVCLHYLSGVHERQGRPALAKVDLEGALMYAKGALPQTKGAIYLDVADSHAQETSLSAETLAQRFLDEAQKYAGASSDLQTLKLGNGLFLLRKAINLLILGRPARALECVDEAETYLTTKRLLVFADILRANCYINLRKPEYEKAVDLLAEAITASQTLRIERHLGHIERLYGKLAASSYGNAPAVADLALALRQVRAIGRG
jgi:tetratricopeptide (TPR) repeat protein